MLHGDILVIPLTFTIVAALTILTSSSLHAKSELNVLHEKLALLELLGQLGRHMDYVMTELVKPGPPEINKPGPR